MDYRGLTRSICGFHHEDLFNREHRLLRWFPKWHSRGATVRDAASDNADATRWLLEKDQPGLHRH